MTITEIYTAEHSQHVYLEDAEGNLYQWNVYAPAAAPVAVPHRPRAGLIRCDDLTYKGFAMSLRAFGHKVAGRMGRPTDNPRTKQIGIRISEQEAELIEKTAERLGITRTDAIIRGIELLNKTDDAGK